MNAVEIEEAVSRLAEQPFDAAAFPFAFLEAFGNKDTTLKRLRAEGKAGTNQSDLPGGVLQRGDIHLKVCPEGEVTAILLADVETVETYQLANIDRVRLERLLHRFFAPARLDLELKDRFGTGVEPQEWFLVPLPAIQDAIRKLMDGTLQDHRYDTESARIIKR